MSGNNLEIFYDAESDLLEIFIGEPTSSRFDEINDDVFEGRDEKTNELKGYKIFNFSKRGGMKGVKIPLPANIRLESG